MNSKLKLTIQLMVQKSELKNVLEILSSLSGAHFTNEVLRGNLPKCESQF